MGIQFSVLSTFKLHLRSPFNILVDDCYLDIDLVLESSDGVRFGAHKINLEQYSAGFPIAEATHFDNEVVTLAEEGSLLGPLLQFMHNVQQPELKKLPFVTLELLAQAVEKYMVFSAMPICQMHMEFVQLITCFSTQ